MKHQERTADSNYVIRLNAERASRAHELMQGIIHETSASKPDEKPAEPSAVVQESEESEDDDKPLGSIFGKRKRRTILSDESDRGSVATADHGSAATADHGSAATASLTSLDDDHKSVLLTVFNDEISTGKILTMAEVRSKMRGHIFLRKMVVHPEFVKKIADFVRYKTNHTRQLQLTQLSDLDDDSCVASLSIESSLRKVWSTYDTAAIEPPSNPKRRPPAEKKSCKSLLLTRSSRTSCNEKVGTDVMRK